jgi:hypothetical protein
VTGTWSCVEQILIPYLPTVTEYINVSVKNNKLQWKVSKAKPKAPNQQPGVTPSLHITPGILFRIGSVHIGSNKKATVSWNLPAGSDLDAYSDLEWALDGATQHFFGSGEDRRTALTTQSLSSGKHVIGITILWVVFTNQYSDAAKCNISSNPDYLFICGYQDTSSVTLRVS